MKQWSWEILPCQDDRQVLEWSKKVIIPTKSMAGLNITHDASRCSAFILADAGDWRWTKVTRMQPSLQPSLLLIFIWTINTISCPCANKCFFFLQSVWLLMLHIKCFEGALEEHGPSGLLLAWFTAVVMSRRGHAGHRNSDKYVVGLINF